MHRDSTRKKYMIGGGAMVPDSIAPAATLQSAAQLLGIKFLDHLILGSSEIENGRLALMA